MSAPAFGLGEMVKNLRLQKGLTQQQLARALSLKGNAFLSRIESGAVVPSVTMQRKLAALLGVNVALLTARAGTHTSRRPRRCWRTSAPHSSRRGRTSRASLTP